MGKKSTKQKEERT